MIKADESRTGVIIRKVFLESLCGKEMREANLLKDIASFVGARKGTLLECSHNRAKLESEQKLVPVMERLARKPVSGGHIISLKWKLIAGGWFESDHISEVVKGHHNIHKVMDDSVYLVYIAIFPGENQIQDW